MIKLCQKEGLETLSIVRKDEYIKDLKDNYGAKHVLSQNSPTFLADLEPIMKEIKPTVLFECVGGDLAGNVFAKMPPKSVMVVYGCLSKVKPTFDSYDFRWGDKNITSLILFRWLKGLTHEER